MRALLPPVAAWLLIPSCTPPDLEAPRTVNERLRLHASDAERHGMGRTRAMEASASEFTWDVPPSWQAQPPAAMQLARFAAADGVEVSVTTLAGNGGGMTANIDRWRAQMGLPPITPEQDQALPRRPLLGHTATMVDLSGKFTAGKTIDDARMLGLVAPHAEGTLFVKLVGPTAAVATQQRAFEQFTASLRPASSPPAAPIAEAAASRPSDSGQVTWTAPTGWLLGEPREMRAVTFHPAGNREVHAYIVILSGMAGGLQANFDRWRSQVGLTALTPTEIEALTKITLLGNSVPLLEAYGEQQGVLGCTTALDADSLFIKMVGPKSALQAAKAEFVQFCASVAVR